MKNNENYGLADVISNAFDLLGFNVQETFKDACKEKSCQCKDNLVKKVNEKKETIKKAIKPIVNMSNTEIRENINGDDYTLMIVATGYDETMVKIQVDPNNGTLTISSSVDIDAVWFMPNINMTVNLPNGILYNSLKKDIKNGVITITGKIENVKESNAFSL